jgi:endoglucanase
MWSRRAVICGWLATGATVALGSASLQAGRWPLWDAYASFFLNGEGRVIDSQGDGRTTSEGQSYGLFFALVANDHERFEQLLSWTSAHLAGGDLGSHLPGWLWEKGRDGRWKNLDNNSAADADLWIAYTLCEAGRLWRQPRYEKLGRRMLALIAAGEVAQLPQFGTMLLPGMGGFHPAPDTWLLNPSYLPLPVLTRLAIIDPRGPWVSIANCLPTLMAKSTRSGFAMDWISYNVKYGFQPASLPGNTGGPGGSYDAIRVYLWAGLTHPETAGQKEILEALPGMADYLATHALPPERIDSAGMMSGANSPLGFSAALLPYLQALDAKSALGTQASRVSAHFNPSTSLYGNPPVYYDENLTLFGLGARQQWFAFGRGGELEVKW